MFGDAGNHLSNMLRDIDAEAAARRVANSIDEANAGAAAWASRYFYLRAIIKRISPGYEIPKQADPYTSSYNYYIKYSGKDLWEKATDIGHDWGGRAPLPPELQAALDAKEHIKALEQKVASLQAEVAARDRALETLRAVNKSNVDEMAGVVAARHVLRKAMSVVWPDHPLVASNEAIRELHSQAKRANQYDTGKEFELAKQAGDIFIKEYGLELKAVQARGEAKPGSSDA